MLYPSYSRVRFKRYSIPYFPSSLLDSVERRQLTTTIVFLPDVEIRILYFFDWESNSPLSPLQPGVVPLGFDVNSYLLIKYYF